MSAISTEQDFFVAGGTLQMDAPCYVERPTDRELYEGLKQGEFCYVLTPRQMGKSSLMIRTAHRLMDEGCTVAVLDLTAVGQNLDHEKWYWGLLSLMGQQVDLEDELDDFWFNNEQLGPLQRFFAAIRQLILPVRERLVIFVDEIDVVRSLPFSTDEFFAAIRSAYNERTDKPELGKLTFCLLGVATPSDLIGDTRMTPFNIGKRIELEDFTLADAAVLEPGLAEDPATGKALLRRILHWTNGHPYLTQRLCRAVMTRGGASVEDDIDAACQDVFLSQAARHQDSNLIFVRERVLHGGGDLAATLLEYQQIYRGKKIAKDERNPAHVKLQLAGITGAVNGSLVVRNRIYRHVFNEEWILASMPDAELRRQKAAFRKGLLRAGVIASVFIVIFASTSAFALYQWNEADAQRDEANEQRERAEGLMLAEKQATQTAEQALALTKEAETAAIAARNDEAEQRKIAEAAKDGLEVALDDLEDALQEAKSAKEKAEEERQAAETARELADQKKDEAETARSAAELAQQAAETARLQAEADRTRAELAENQAIADRERADLQRETAEQNANIARRRGRLFEQLLPLLQDHAAEGVLQYAQQLQAEGNDYEAMSFMAEFCELAIGGDQGGFFAQELLQLDPADLEGIDVESTQISITVPPESLTEFVLQPAIELGERLVAEDASPENRDLLASVYVYRAQVLTQHDVGLPNAAELTLASYDRAAELAPQNYENYIGRATAQFRLDPENLQTVVTDLDSAIELYPKPSSDEPEATMGLKSRFELSQILSARANVLEYLAEKLSGEDQIVILERAEADQLSARSLDPRNPKYLLGAARLMRKRIANALTVRVVQLDETQKLLLQVIDADPEIHAAHNELGETYLLENEIDQARQSFENAIKTAGETGGAPVLYAYYCNLANAITRQPVESADFQAALQAADKALTFANDDTADAQYLRALALWKLEQLPDALDALANVLDQQPAHADGLLAKCQIIFEMKDPAATTAQIQQAYADMKAVLNQSRLTIEQHAKANYVNSLAYLKHHLDARSEESLLKCQQFALQAAKESPAYLAHAQQIFDHAANHDWQDAELQQQSASLRAEFAAASSNQGQNQ